MAGEASERRRLAPGVPLPPYAFVPGSALPHPTSDPAGHSFGKRGSATQPVGTHNWGGCTPYLYALDLFNHGYYWEAHEEWETLWQACGRVGLTADFLKALIKLAAAGVKAREGKPAGVCSHARAPPSSSSRWRDASNPGRRIFSDWTRWSWPASAKRSTHPHRCSSRSWCRRLDREPSGARSFLLEDQAAMSYGQRRELDPRCAEGRVAGCVLRHQPEPLFRSGRLPFCAAGQPLLAGTARRRVYRSSAAADRAASLARAWLWDYQPGEGRHGFGR